MAGITPSGLGYSSQPAGRSAGFNVGGFGGGSAPASNASLANSAIQQLLGGNTGAMAPGQMGSTPGMPPNRPGATPAQSPAAPSAPGPTTNTANPNPASQTAIQGLQNLSAPNAAASTATQGLLDQASNKSGLYGQIDQNIQDIRDRASQGIAGSQQLSRIQRGVSGSGIDVSDKRALDKSQQNDINRMTTDATLGWEKERSNNLQAAGSMGLNSQGQQIGATSAAGNMGLSQGAQQLAQQQEARAQQNQMFQQQQQQDAALRDSQMQGWNTILNLLS